MAAHLDQLRKSFYFNEMLGFEQAPEEVDCTCYLRALVCCANGDGHFSEKERAWVLGHTAIVAPSYVEFMRTYEGKEDVAKVVAERPAVAASTHALIYDSIRACAADGDFSPQERETVIRMAGTLQVSRDDVAKIEAAWREEMKARDARLKAILPGGRPL